MIYLDNAANSVVDERVLDSFVMVTKDYIANPNSSHFEGVRAMKRIDSSREKIASYFNCDKESVIFTSGASEANNLVIKGIAFRNDKNKNIILSSVEHSSVVAPANYLASLGYKVHVVPVLENGKVDVSEIKRLINNDTILVSICAVDSELGIIQPISEIKDIVKNYPNCFFHTDATQAVGKTKIDFSGVDFITFAPHKFYGLNGSGVLLNVNNKPLVPIIHGGKSVTKYRSGTPDIAAITSLEVALSLAMDNLDDRYQYVSGLNKYLKDSLDLSYVHINSTEDSIPNTLNISLKGIPKKYVLQELEKENIYISSTSACSNSDMSKTVYMMTKDEELANNTLRISISFKNTKEEIDTFIKVFKKVCEGYNENN